MSNGFPCCKASSMRFNDRALLEIDTPAATRKMMFMQSVGRMIGRSLRLLCFLPGAKTESMNTAIALATLCWAAFHYFTGMVRISMIRQRSIAEQPLFIATERDTIWTPIWIHVLPIMVERMTKRAIRIDLICFLAIRAVLAWFAFYKIWSLFF